MSDAVELPLQGCGCCEATVSPAPAAVENPPGAPALAYRAGTQDSFLEAMRIGAATQPALRGLRTREPDDPAVALMDAWAATLDVLTFYTERIANEAYLGTATELLSLIELARTVGYERGPGRASETVLAFTLEDSPGSPDEVPIPVGTKVASLPGPGETPQTFETTTELLARPERNALASPTSAAAPPVAGDTRLYLAGAATGLRPGDQLLIVGRDDSPTTGHWLLRTVRRVTVSGTAGGEVTEVGWDEPLGEGRGGAELVPVAEDVRVYALRLRTALFGANAPDWRVIPDTVQENYEGGDSFAAASVTIGGIASTKIVHEEVPEGPDDWPGFTVVPPGAPANTVDLDGDHPQVGSPSWLALQRDATVALYDVQSVTALTRSDYALSGKVTRVVLAGGPNVATTFSGGLRTVIASARSDRLVLAEAPVTEPVQGRTFTLATPLEPALPVGHLVVVSGPRPRLAVADNVHSLVLITSGGASSTLHPGHLLVATEAAPAAANGSESRMWTVRSLVDDQTGTVVAGPDELVVVPAGDDDEVFAELATVAEAPAGAADPGQLHLAADLAGIYDRGTVRVAANVVGASHGETRAEVLGGGDATVSFPRFRLAQAPLTYRVGAAGAFSTLEVRVDGVRWDEVASLALAGQRDRVYTTEADDAGRVTVIFGDGTFGARLPTGQENVAATYRVGTGLAGRLVAGRLTMLLTRPLGVRSVTNPLPTGIAADADPLEALRRSAPRTALTLDRVVSLTDFADFARATPGIAKASATWAWRGEDRVVHLAVAGDAGQELDDQARHDLAQAIRSAGDTRQPLVIDQAAQPTFDLSATLFVEGTLQPGAVAAACIVALETDFGFEARDLGQGVTASEVVASAHRVPGVIAVTLTLLRKSERTGMGVETVLLAGPAELLTIRPAGISLIESAP